VEAAEAVGPPLSAVRDQQVHHLVVDLVVEEVDPPLQEPPQFLLVAPEVPAVRPRAEEERVTQVEQMVSL
jgi:hypothetical protein